MKHVEIELPLKFKRDNMNREFNITREILSYLEKEKYQTLVRTFDSNTFVPYKVDAVIMVDYISTVPLKEDEMITIRDAIEFFDDLGLDGMMMIDIFEV